MLSSDSPIGFVTSNPRKVRELQERLSPLGIEIEQLEAELSEPQSVDNHEIAKVKLVQARSMFPGRRLLVDDRGLSIPALKGFPGPFIKLVITTIGAAGLLKLMADELDRRAIFVYALGYYDGKVDHFFTRGEEGVLTTEARGTNLHGWSDIFTIWGSPVYPGRSLAELDDAEYAAYQQTLAETDVLKDFAEFLKQQAPE